MCSSDLLAQVWTTDPARQGYLFPGTMPHQRSPLAPFVVATLAVALLWQLHSFVAGSDKTAFIPAAALASQNDNERVTWRQRSEQAATGALSALMASPLPALAQEQEEDEGFDGRILAILGLPLLAISWALFNVWRSVFRQVVRFTTSTKGGQKEGLNAED